MKFASIRALFIGVFMLPAVISAVDAQTHVEALGTALNHMTTVQVPEEVENVAVGSPQIHVEWHDSIVLIQPLKPNVKTNMIVFTADKSYYYEILPASDPAQLSMIVREPAPPKPIPPPQPTPGEVQRNHDALFTELLMTARPVNTQEVRRKKHTVNVRVQLVSQDADNYYIRLHAENNGRHSYRLQTPAVMKLDPAFGTDVAYDHVNRQLGKKNFRKFRSYQQQAVEVHSSTLTREDMTPDTAVDFVIALSKPKVTPAVFRFVFPSDDGQGVDAIAVF